MIRTSLKKHKNLMFFLSVMIAFGFFCGVIYYLKLGDSLQNLIINELSVLLKEKFIINFNFYHVMIIILVSIFSFLLIGPILGVFSIFYESFSIGLIVCAFVKEYAFNGLLFSILYCLLSKIGFIILMILNVFLSLKLLKNIISKNNKHNDYYLNIYKYLKLFTLIIVVVILNELVFMPIANKVCCYLTFIIK